MAKQIQSVGVMMFVLSGWFIRQTAADCDVTDDAPPDKSDACGYQGQFPCRSGEEYCDTSQARYGGQTIGICVSCQRACEQLIENKFVNGYDTTKEDCEKCCPDTANGILQKFNESTTTSTTHRSLLTENVTTALPPQMAEDVILQTKSSHHNYAVAMTVSLIVAAVICAIIVLFLLVKCRERCKSKRPGVSVKGQKVVQPGESPEMELLVVNHQSPVPGVLATPTNVSGLAIDPSEGQRAGVFSSVVSDSGNSPTPPSVSTNVLHSNSTTISCWSVQEPYSQNDADLDLKSPGFGPYQDAVEHGSAWTPTNSWSHRP